MRWPNAGFPHPHAGMEIITHVRAGYRRTRIVSTTKAEPKPEMRKARAHYALSGTIDWVAPYEDLAGLRQISSERSRE
jgi:hypothetical protein